ncbi:MAG: sugar kinase [Oscillospiraceae bacterium]|nr:sugar kinase [Oscillospiraceae bacterium]
MKKVVSFGEIMMRLVPPGYLRINQAHALEMTFGGAEANVAVSLANYGVPVSYLTRMPQNDIAEACLQQLRGFGVDVSHVARGGDRLGIYFAEKGASMRPSKVIYDRKYASIATIEPGDIDWARAFEGADWFHFTGITPALSEKTAAATLEACKVAKEMGLTISCDLNYRKNLWSREQAKKTMTALMAYVDVMIANEEDSQDVFGIAAEGADIEGGALSVEGYRGLARKLAQTFDCKKVAFTLRESFSANDNGWSGLLYDAAADSATVSRKYAIHIVDRVGGGDSFGAGLIYALRAGESDENAINFAVAASALKHTIEGDFNRVTLREVQNLMGGSVSGRVQR